MARLRHVVLLVLFVAVSLSKTDSYEKCPEDARFSPRAKRGEPLSRCSLQQGDKGCQTGLHCCQEQINGGPGLCIDLTKCEASTCNSNGACVELVGGGILCTCNPGFEGDNCETDLNYCDSSPCENGGICTEETTGFTCACDAAFTGKTCCTDVTECGASTCNSNGDCLELVGGGVKCDCNPGFLGDNCETDINYCDSSPCENGGTCNEETTGFTCSCGASWTGTTCGTDVIDCGASTCNSNGDCLELVGGGVKCNCNPGFLGTTCGTARCPAKWIYASGSNKCLRILTSSVDFGTARTDCQNEGGRLAQLTTSEALEEAVSLLDSEGALASWVDISQTEGDCDSFATPDGVIIPSNSLLWLPGYPIYCHDGIGTAVAVTGGSYIDGLLTWHALSLCEIDL